MLLFTYKSGYYERQLDLTLQIRAYNLSPNPAFIASYGEFT